MERNYGLQDAGIEEFTGALEMLRTKGWTENRNGNQIQHLAQLWDKGRPYSKFQLRDIEGRFYIGFYRYDEELALIDTHISSIDGNILTSGFMPLFVRETQLLRIKDVQNNGTYVPADAEHLKKPILWTMRKTLYKVIIDRVMQFLKYDTIYAGHLRNDIDAVLRRIEIEQPQTPNAKAGKQSRIILIPSANGGPWGCEFNPGHAYGDGLRKSASITPQAHDLMSEFFLVEPGSESSGSQGVYVCFDSQLQELRGNPTDLIYSDIGYEVFTDENGKQKVASLYVKRNNVISRHRSMVAGDAFIAPQSMWNECYSHENEGEPVPVFKRFHNYIRPSEKSDTENFTQVNMLVAFGTTNPEAKQYADMKTFFDADKNEVSRTIEGADGCISISPQVGDIQMIRKRTMRKNLQWDNFTVDFRQALERADKGERVFWEACNENPIAHYTECPACARLTVPVNITRDLYKCVMCDTEHKSMGNEVKYPHNGGIYITGYQVRDMDVIDDDLGEDMPRGLEAYDIFIEVEDKINCSRVVSSEGIKGMIVARNQDYIGYADIPELSDSPLPLDGLVYSNSNKSDRNGIAMSLIRLQTVIESRKMDEDAEFKELSLPINKILRHSNEANEFLEQNVTITKRPVFRTVIKDGKAQMISQELYVGIVQIKVTEAGAEFQKIRERDVKFTHQLCTSLHTLGKDDLRRKIHKYSLDYSRRFSNRPQICGEAIMMLHANSVGVPMYQFDDIQDMELAVTTVQSYMHIDKWKLLINESPVFNDFRFKDGFVLSIPLKEKDRQIRFPSKKFIESFEQLGADSHIFIPDFLAAQLRILLSLQSSKLKTAIDDQGRTHIESEAICKRIENQLDTYERSLCKIVVGKKSVIARLAAFSGLSQGGKQFGCEYLPTGVAVINDMRAWNRIGKEAIEVGLCTEEQFKSGDVEIYGFSLRDPNIWALQACSVVRLWNVHKANDYFYKNYGVQYCTFEKWTGDYKQKALYYNPVGVTLNVLDMIYLNQSDADGDYIRNYPPLDTPSQNALKEFSNEMINYDFINPYKVDESAPHYFLVNTSAEWHHKYAFGKLLYDEDSDETLLEEGETTTDKHDFPVDQLVYTSMIWDKEELSKLVIKGFKQKTMIGSVTTSLWKLVATAEYLYQTGEITKEIRDTVIFLYQSEFLQDGCIRLLKHSGSLDAITIDKIGKNEELELDNGDKVPCQEEISKKGSHFNQETLKNFFFVCRRYVEFLGWRFDAKTKRFKKDKEADTSIGQMILAYCNFGNGSQAGLLSGENKQMDPNQVRDFLKSLTGAAAGKVYHKEMFEFALPTIMLCNNKTFIEKEERNSLEEALQRRIEATTYVDEVESTESIENQNAVN